MAKASAPPSAGRSSSPSSVHQITGTVSLYPRLGTVAMYSRLTSSPSLSDLRSSEILCVTTWLVTTFRVQTFSISSSRLSTSPGWRAKKTRRSIKRGSRVSWRPFLLIWFTEGVTSHSPTRTTGCSIQESPRQKGKGAMITHLSYLFCQGSLPQALGWNSPFSDNKKQYFINIVIIKTIYSDKNAFSPSLSRWNAGGGKKISPEA